MKGSQDKKFKLELKELIIKECDLEIDPDEVSDDGAMFGPDSEFGLDSIDALQISMALKNKYGVSITDSKEMRRIMVSLNTFADYLQPE
jgi:acyl carrier protein